MTKSVFIKIVPILGSLILFLSWVFQQFLLDHANSEIENINAAQNIFRTYQSNNALFNAIEAVTNDPESVDRIRRSQIYNYEFGLTELEAVLDEKERTDIPPRPGPAIWNGDLDLDALNQTTQERIDKIQGKLMVKKDNIAKHKSTLSSIFLVFYAIGSVTVLIGSALNTIMSAKRELEEKAKSDGSESKENEEKESGHAEAGTS